MNMHASILLTALIGILTIFPLMADNSCGPRQVALTFDDPPLPDTVVMSGKERTRRIIEALADAEVSGAMFFAVSSRIDDSNISRMHAYAEAGHVIASHSDTHANLHNVGVEAFIRDIYTADRILSGLPGFKPWFRFPYLNEGETIEQRDEIRISLDKLGYRQGYVTIDNYDFFIDRLLREAVQAEESFDIEAVGDLYSNMLLNAAEHYDEIACTWLGRSPRHVLLLHENDVAALFLPRLISEFRERGWTIISALQAYKDPIANKLPDTLFLGQGRVAALAAEAGADVLTLRHEGEDVEVLRAEFESVVSD